MSDEVKKSDAQYRNAAELAKILQSSESEIIELEKAGVLHSTGRGENKKFKTIEAVHEYCEYLRKRAKGYKESRDEKELEKLKEEVRYKEAKAEIEEIELKLLKGEMHAAEDVEHFTVNLVFAMRSMLLALPGRLAMDAAEETDEKKLFEIISREIRGITENLREYSYNLDEYQKRLRERKGAFQTEESEDPENEK